ncbi:MAG: O-antigen biosynthesis protein WbqP [Oceanicaulis sp. HLUCCA04]|nr:MAG: O-antigen biosynthesis protein WbqP [Oceanicaulis sp. HLUCCA04]
MSIRGTLLGRDADGLQVLRQNVRARMPGQHGPAPREKPERARRGHQTGGMGKRLFDLVMAGSALVFMLPLLLAAALLVRLTSRGPILFWSARDNGNGGTFAMPKFRTMRAGSPLQPREQFANAHSSMTPPGQFLRRTSLDELPQLIPVLTGKMSLIGPRPLLPSDPTIFERRLLANGKLSRPCLTGLAQISGRNSLTPRRKARYDQFYTDHWSWRLDMWILWRTVKVVISRAGVL